MLVDEHRSLREPLAMLLEQESDFVVTEQAGSWFEVQRLIDAGARADIAIVEIDLGDGSGFEVIRQLRARLPDSDVLVLTGNKDERRHGCALRAGASGIVSKTAPPHDVVAAVRKLAAGESLMPLAEAAVLLDLSEQYEQEVEVVRAALAKMTPREHEVLFGLAAGLSNEAIAARLYIGSETVRSHVVRILHKLGASSRLQAAVLVHRHGLHLEHEMTRDPGPLASEKARYEKATSH
jgi:DNA-binding NarL/FixJ family response regulator